MKALCAMAVAVLAAVAAGADDKKDDKKPDFAKLIVGKWEITKTNNPDGAPAGTVLVFGKDKKVTMALKVGDEEVEVEGTYTIEKDKLTLKMKLGQQEQEETLTIKKLTDKGLELVDKDEFVDELKRVPGKEA